MNASLRSRATRLSALSMMLMASLLLFQCGKKDGDDPAPSGNAIVGTWKFTGFSAKTKDGKVEDQTALVFAFVPCLAELRLTFKNDGTTSGSGGQSCGTVDDVLPEDFTGQGKWSLNGGKLTMTDASGAKEEYDVELSGNTLKINVPDVDDTTGKPTGDTVIITMTKA